MRSELLNLLREERKEVAEEFELFRREHVKVSDAARDVLLILCWPLALVALVLYPFVWLFLLPFRLMGIAVEGALELVRAIIMLPARILRGPRSA